LPELVDLPGVAHWLGCTKRTVSRYVARKMIPRPFKIGFGRVLWRRQDLIRWQADGCPRIGHDPQSPVRLGAVDERRQ
jgi:predicted DNA-binding transcriptional regulator AlpA